MQKYNNILIYNIGYVKPNSIKPLYLIIKNAKVHTEECNGNKYLTLFATDESRDTLK